MPVTFLLLLFFLQLLEVLDSYFMSYFKVFVFFAYIATYLAFFTQGHLQEKYMKSYMSHCA